MDVKKYIMLQNQQQQNNNQDIQEGQRIYSSSKLLPTINNQNNNNQNATIINNNDRSYQNRNNGQSYQNTGNISNNTNNQSMRIGDLKQLERQLESEKRDFLNLTKIKITKSNNNNPHLNLTRGKSQESFQRSNNKSKNTAYFNSNQDQSNEQQQYDQDSILQQNNIIEQSLTSRDNTQQQFNYKQRSGSTQKIRIGYNINNNTRNNLSNTLKKESSNINLLNKFLNSTDKGSGFNNNNNNDGTLNEDNHDSSNNLDIFLKQEGFNSNTALNNNNIFSQTQQQQQQLFISKGSQPQLVYEALPLHIREFYQSRKDFMKSFEEYDLTNKCLHEVNERVRCYRYELGCLIDKIQNSFFKIYEKTLDQTIKLYNDNRKKFENQIKENLINIEKLEREKRDIESTNRDLKNRYVVQESLFKITKINHDSLQSEVILLHDLLKRDVLHKINHIGQLETQQNKIFNSKDDPSEKMAQGLNSLNHLIRNLEGEQGMKDNMMSQMSGLVKAMLKGSKQDAFTQVDEGELIWLPQEIVGNGRKPNLPSVLEAEISSVNIINLYNNPLFANKDEINNRTNIEQLKLKENEINGVTTKKNNNSNNQDNWNLTINLIVFIENVTKQNENGRVIPWLHFKNMIFEIYEDRLKNNWEINGSLLSTTIPFDEYLCMYFLKQQKLRRMAEIKIFEFLISLRYYMKNHTRAMTFALLCNVSQITSTSNDTFTFKFDIFIQNFFLFGFKRLNDYKKSFIEQDGFTYIQKDVIPSLIKDVLVFMTENARQKVISKVGKACIKLSDDQEVIEVDKILDAYLEEYIEAKKKIIRNLTKNYSKVYESDHGVFSIDDLTSVIKESVEINSQLPSNRYPSVITYARAFLHSLTSTRNKFDVSPKEFLIACTKFGIDSPFPFIRLGSSFDREDGDSEELLRRHKGKGDQDQNKEGNEVDTSKDKQNNLIKSRSKQSIGEGISNHMEQKMLSDIPNEVVQSKNQIKIDSTSALFAQHFSILREMRQYCKNFKESYTKEEDKDILWTQFGNILNVLEAGCQFLNFPINV